MIRKPEFATFLAISTLAIYTISYALSIDKIGYTVLVAPNNVISPLSKGLPASGKDGETCLRDGNNLLIIDKHGRKFNLDFTAAIDDAIKHGKKPADIKWDGGWDKSLMVDTAIVFNKKGYAFTIVVPRNSNIKTSFLLWSRDGCRHWIAVPLTGRAATIEKPSYSGMIDDLPTVVSYENYGPFSGKRLWLEVFKWDQKVVARRSAGPILVSQRSILPPNHSGGANSTWTGKKRIVVVFPVDDHKNDGTMNVSREYDNLSDKWLGPEQDITRSSSDKGPDPHDVSGISILPSGKLVVVVGGHHSPIKIVESLANKTAEQGWTDEQWVGDPYKGQLFKEYSYPSLDISKDGTINIFARAEAQGRFRLVQLQRDRNRRWRLWSGNAPHRVIAEPLGGSYAAWRQRVNINQNGCIYVHFAYYVNNLTQEEASALGILGQRRQSCRLRRCWYLDAPTINPRTLISCDRGNTWR